MLRVVRNVCVHSICSAKPLRAVIPSSGLLRPAPARDVSRVAAGTPTGIDFYILELKNDCMKTISNLKQTVTYISVKTC